MTTKADKKADDLAERIATLEAQVAALIRHAKTGEALRLDAK